MRMAMKLLQSVLFGLLLLLGTVQIFADMISPSHNCPKPITPSHFASQTDRTTFDRQVGAYKQCLSDFINEQNKEARMHSEAARKATNDLKQVRT